MDFRFVFQEEEARFYHGLNFCRFSLDEFDVLPDDAAILDAFFMSAAFNQEFRSAIIKRAGNHEAFLRKAFNSEVLRSGHFKIVAGVDLQKYFNIWTAPEYRLGEWGKEDRDAFLFMKNRVFDLLPLPDHAYFFFADKDWFDEKDPVINDPEHWVYGYYVLVFFLDREKRELTALEWYND
ncbi:hypothetical protein ACTHGU_00900 [Chitinophagaceae bacterium MMS25-I14]